MRFGTGAARAARATQQGAQHTSPASSSPPHSTPSCKSASPCSTSAGRAPAALQDGLDAEVVDGAVGQVDGAVVQALREGHRVRVVRAQLRRIRQRIGQPELAPAARPPPARAPHASVG